MRSYPEYELNYQSLSSMDDIDDVSKERSCSSQNMGMAQCGTLEPTSPTWRPGSTRNTLRTPQSTAAKQPGINPDQKKQAMRPETPKMDQNGSSPTRNHRKFPQFSIESQEVNGSINLNGRSHHISSPHFARRFFGRNR